MTENTNPVQSIRETITAKLEELGINTAEYGGYNSITGVTEALEERETEAAYALREEILEQVEEKLGGSYTSEAMDVLDAVGLEARPEPEPEPVTPDAGFTTESEPADDDRLGRLEAKVDALVRLAESRLGASL